MPEEFAEYLAGYLKKQSDKFQIYLLEALENKDHCVSVLASSGGVMLDSKDIRNFELLCDAKIFEEKIQFSRSGRNEFKIFCLTDLGLKLAEGLKKGNVLTVLPP